MSKTPTVWINGELMPADEVRISPFDLGLSVGFGVFETMAAYEGKVFAYGLHHARLEHSAHTLGLTAPGQAEVEAAMNQVIGANQYQQGRCRIRVSISGGDNPLHGGEQVGKVMVTAAPVAEVARLATLVPVPYSTNEYTATSGIKSTSYADHVLAYRYALRAGGDEALMLNTRGHLCEGAMSNVFLVSDGVVKTPPLSSGCLPGVTRGIVIGLCEESGVKLEECELTERDAFAADELFLTSSLREVQAAVMLGDERARREAAGEITARLAEAYTNFVRKELGL